jgi:acetyl-CoA acyltransferase 2
MCSESNVVLTGGVDSMSQSPHVVRNARFGIPLGASYVFEDSLWTGLTDTFCQLPMALTAEKLAEVYKITRQEVDEFAFRSQTLWKKGNNNFNNNFIVLFKFKMCTNYTNNCFIIL